MTRLRQSLALRLLLIFLLVSACLVALLAATLARGFGEQWRGSIGPHLSQYLHYIHEDIGYPPDIERAKALTTRLPIHITIDGPEGVFSTHERGLEFDKLEFYDDFNRWRERRPRYSDLQAEHRHLRFGELDDRAVLRNQIGDYTLYYEVLHADKRDIGASAFLHTLGWLAAILGLAYWMLRRMLRPVHDIKHGVARMGAGELDYRVPVRADNDLGKLAGSINQMSADIEAMLDAKRQLLLALSHELRSPLTRAKVAVQMLEPTATQQSLDEDLNEMQALISEILEAERMNGRHAALNLTEVDPAALLQGMADEYADRGVEAKLAGGLPKMRADETRLKLLLRNLLNNALTHSREADRAPQLLARTRAGALQIEVRDFGAGIEPQHLQRLTEPFYRADSSRTRATGGFGLGLHLCRLIAEAHGGALSIESELGAGSCMRVTLPTAGAD